MSEPRQELQGLSDSYYLMDRLINENEELKARTETAERQADLLQSENENLHRDIRRADTERDRYFRAYTWLSAQLEGFQVGMENAVSQSRAQVYGERLPITEIKKTAPEGDKELPSFLRRLQGASDAPRGTGDAEPTVPVDLNSLALSIAG
jgi:hypothetical protein